MSSSSITLTGTQATGLMALIASMGIALMLVGLVLWILLVIAHWMMFEKAGEKGWKAIIPIYSDYIAFKIAWSGKAFWIFFVVTIIVSVLSATYSVNGTRTSLMADNPVIAIIAFVGAIFLLVWFIMYCLKTCKAFGKGTGMGVLMVFFPNIVTLILGFGSAQYVGPQK